MRSSDGNGALHRPIASVLRVHDSIGPSSRCGLTRQGLSGVSALVIAREEGKVTVRRSLMVCKSNNVVTFADAACRAGRYDSYGMKKLITTLAVVLCCTLGTVALAADPHTSSTKGQPNQSCETSMVRPGKALTSPGSAFNEASPASAHYANPTTQGGISSGNTHVVSQYDVACFQQAMRELQQTARTTERATKMAISRGHGR